MARATASCWTSSPGSRAPSRWRAPSPCSKPRRRRAERAPGRGRCPARRMIHVPTAAWAHTAFDLAAWASGLGLSALLSRWRLRELAQAVARKVDGGYFAALALGAIPGAWLAGSLNTLRD